QADPRRAAFGRDHRRWWERRRRERVVVRVEEVRPVVPGLGFGRGQRRRELDQAGHVGWLAVVVDDLAPCLLLGRACAVARLVVAHAHPTSLSGDASAHAAVTRATNSADSVTIRWASWSRVATW